VDLDDDSGRLRVSDVGTGEARNATESRAGTGLSALLTYRTRRTVEVRARVRAASPGTG